MKSLRIGMEIIVHCLCGSDGYIVVISLETSGFFSNSADVSSGKLCFQRYNHDIHTCRNHTNSVRLSLKYNIFTVDNCRLFLIANTK